MRKIVTFSFDDGVTQDARLGTLFKKYGMKATFNICTGKFGVHDTMYLGEERLPVCGDKNTEEDARRIYKDFEVASHTRTHPALLKCDRVRVLEEIIYDYLRLEEIFGKEVIGMAYPGCIPNHDNELARFIKNNTFIRYARTTICTHSFNFPTDYMVWNPTMHILDQNAEILVEKFAKENTDALFYIWGHAYEMDRSEECWKRVEKLLQKISLVPNVEFLTNKQIYEKFHDV